MVPEGSDCHLGTSIQPLYFNLEVRCFEELSVDCTSNETCNGDGYVGLFGIIDTQSINMCGFSKPSVADPFLVTRPVTQTKKVVCFIAFADDIGFVQQQK